MRIADKRRLQRLEAELIPEPGMYLFVDQNGAEHAGTLREMMGCRGIFQRTLTDGNGPEGLRLIRYICELWDGTEVR